MWIFSSWLEGSSERWGPWAVAPEVCQKCRDWWEHHKLTCSWVRGVAPGTKRFFAFSCTRRQDAFWGHRTRRLGNKNKFSQQGWKPGRESFSLITWFGASWHSAATEDKLSLMTQSHLFLMSSVRRPERLEYTTEQRTCLVRCHRQLSRFPLISPTSHKSDVS